MMMHKVKLPGWTNGARLNFRRHRSFRVLFDYMKNFRVWVVSETLSASRLGLHICYFSGICLIGLIPLHMSTTKSKQRLSLLDALYTCVSALTVTSLGSVRMEDFSEFQLSVLIVLMLLGGEVFTSTLCLHAKRAAYKYFYHERASTLENVECGDHGAAQMANHAYPIQNTVSRAGMNGLLDVPLSEFMDCTDNRVEDKSSWSSHSQTEMVDTYPQKRITDLSFVDKIKAESNIQRTEENDTNAHEEREHIFDDVLNTSAHKENLECRLAISHISYIATIYLAVVQIVGILLISICFTFSPQKKKILEQRGVKISTFAVFTTVSSFANCGFTPLDDNMLPFRKDSILLFILAGQILLGNTLYAPTLRAIIYTLHRFRNNNGAHGRVYDYILETNTKLYDHLFPRTYSIWLTLTAVGFLTVQVIMFCALQWESEALEGLNTYEKFVSGIFQTIAMRHAGENVVDPQLLSHALIVLYIVMMYLPPYPINFSKRDTMNVNTPPEKNFGKDIWRTIRAQLKKLIQNDPCYLIVAIIVICITERNSLFTDPLNYSVLHIVFEVISAYGNVGISMGYSCRLLKRLSSARCEDVPVSFSGKWSAEGKAVIIIVMFMGRLKGIK